MIYCKACGNELSDGSSFCTKCGTRRDDTAPITRAQSIDTEVVKEKIGKTFNQAKGSIQKSGYIDYFKKTAKYPSLSLNLQKSNNGMIHFGILSLVTVLAMYFLISGTITVAMNQTGLAFLSVLENGLMSQVTKLLPNLFLMSITTYGVFIFSAYMMLKFLVKKDISLTELLTEFGGLLTPNIILVSISAILTFFIKSQNMMFIGLSVLGFTLLLMFVALNYYIFKKSGNQSNSTFYVLLISNFLVFLLFSIMIYVQVEPIITTINNMETLGW